MSETKIFASIRRRRIRVGGEEHSGWLPEGFIKPLPTPVREIEFDFEILDDGDGHFLFCYEACDRSFINDTWHDTLDDAINEATRSFGIAKVDWTFHA